MQRNLLKINTPLTDEVVSSLSAGDNILLNGKIYSARDMAHKRLCEAIEQKGRLPMDLEGAVIYFLGPTPARPGKPIGASGPTTSSRMDPFSPTLLDHGLKAMIGKGYRGQNVVDSLKKNNAVHLAAIGGAGALLSKHIISSKIIAYSDLGTEAIRELQVVDFPLLVAYDSKGRTIYKI